MTAHDLGPTSHAYISQRLRLHFVDWGNKDAPPVLLVHGGRDHCRSWDWVAEDLRKDYHVLAVDLRGHGDSAWVTGSSYPLFDFVYDIEHLIRQERLAPVSIISHSMGGAISLTYAGTYPETVAKLVTIEGLIWTPAELEKFAAQPTHERISKWVEQLHKLATRHPRRYDSLAQAVERMQGENPRLTPDQARHLTTHGMAQNEDGTFSWKFDNYIRARSPFAMSASDAHRLFERVTCPTLMIGGTESFVPDPIKSGALDSFPNVKSVMVRGAGHWVHHDNLSEFLGLVRPFLAQ